MARQANNHVMLSICVLRHYMEKKKKVKEIVDDECPLSHSLHQSELIFILKAGVLS